MLKLSTRHRPHSLVALRQQKTRTNYGTREPPKQIRIASPREIFDAIREHVTPAITAVATLLILLATTLMGTMKLLRRRSERLGGRRE
jgi:hypothetical protein